MDCRSSRRRRGPLPRCETESRLSVHSSFLTPRMPDQVMLTVIETSIVVQVQVEGTDIDTDVAVEIESTGD